MALNLPSGSTSGPSGNLHFGATRTLQDNYNAASAADGDRALALKVFSGTVLEAFRAKTVFYDNTGNIMAMKMLNGGHVAQWPIIGDDVVLADIGSFFDANTDGDWAETSLSPTPDSVGKDDSGLTLGYHNPGDFIAGRKIKMSERTVRVDDTLVSAIDIPFQDMDLSHFDVIRPYATKLGRALAIDNDKKIATMAMKAARTAAVAGVHPGGQVAHNSGASAINATGGFDDTTTGAANFRKHAAMLAEMFDNDNVPEDGRFLFIPPFIRRILRRELDVFNRDYNPDAQAGDLNSRTIGLLEGFNLVLTNHLPSGSTGGRYKTAFGDSISGGMHKYDYNNSGADEATGDVAAIALCGASEGSAGVGMVQASGIRTVVEDDERRNVKFMKAQMMVGYDVLSPWCAGVISTGTS